MTRHIFVVQTDPAEGRDGECNDEDRQLNVFEAVGDLIRPAPLP
jgi:hypothetical protein